jgi:hypothetical protein
VKTTGSYPKFDRASSHAKPAPFTHLDAAARLSRQSNAPSTRAARGESDEAGVDLGRRSPRRCLQRAYEGEGIIGVVADKGHHSNQVMVDLEAVGVSSYISESDRGRRNWKDNPEARHSVNRNRWHIRGARGRRLLGHRGERLERPFAHLYETGRMRRTHLRGHDNILKRVLLHAGALNLGLLLRTLWGVGTPRALQGRLSVALGYVWSLIRLPETIWTPLSTLFRPSALPSAQAPVARYVKSQ